MLDRFKAFWQGKALAPFINLFIKLGISPDAVTLVGTLPARGREGSRPRLSNSPHSIGATMVACRKRATSSFSLIMAVSA